MSGKGSPPRLIGTIRDHEVLLGGYWGLLLDPFRALLEGSGSFGVG